MSLETAFFARQYSDAVLLAGFLAATGSSSMQTYIRSRASSRPTADLLKRIAEGDAGSFRVLYTARSGQLYAIALRITRSPALASDAVHDALLQVWRNAARYDVTRGDADGWLVSLVRYRALDIARRQAREVTGLDVPDRLDEDPDALSRLIGDSQGEALRACLDQVDLPRRKLVLLAFFDGLTQSEIAAKLGQPIGTVKSSIRRALIGLRACLADLSVSDPESKS